MQMPIMFWGFAAGSLAVLAEYLYKTITQPWSHYVWAWVPIQTTIGYCIYRLVTYPHTNLLDAFVTFAFATISLRVSTSQFLLHEDIRTGTWIALALIVLAKLSQAAWGR